MNSSEALTLEQGSLQHCLRAVAGRKWRCNRCLKTSQTVTVLSSSWEPEKKYYCSQTTWQQFKSKCNLSTFRSGSICKTAQLSNHTIYFFGIFWYNICIPVSPTSKPYPQSFACIPVKTHETKIKPSKRITDLQISAIDCCRQTSDFWERRCYRTNRQIWNHVWPLRLFKNIDAGQSRYRLSRSFSEKLYLCLLDACAASSCPVLRCS